MLFRVFRTNVLDAVCVCRGMRCSLFAAQEFVMVRYSVRTDDSEEGFNVFHNAYYENILETITININFNSI